MYQFGIQPFVHYALLYIMAASYKTKSALYRVFLSSVLTAAIVLKIYLI